MSESWRRLAGMVAVWLSLGPASWAQGGKAAGELAGADTTTALMEMAGRAGVIFVGHVISITHNDAAGYVDVRFGIDQPVSGCPATNEYGVREWVGLWLGHATRYEVGQRFLMLLHAPGASGMSAPVGDGAIPLVSAGLGPVMDVHGNASADTGPGASSGVAADLRWVQARGLRTVGERKTSVAKSAQATAPGAIGELTQVSLESVLAVLRGVGSGSR